MGNNNKAPGLFGADAGAMLSKRYGKYNGFYLTPQQRRLFDLLIDGYPRSAAEISVALRLSDPRGVIRNLRRTGIYVSDYWEKGGYGVRFKRYFIRKERTDE